jgi:hypothetical protein
VVTEIAVSPGPKNQVGADYKVVRLIDDGPVVAELFSKKRRYAEED